MTRSTTHITAEHQMAFESLISGEYDNFALFSCTVNNDPAAAIVYVHENADKTCHIIPWFVSLTPAMRLTDHAGVTIQLQPSTKEGN